MHFLFSMHRSMAQIFLTTDLHISLSLVRVYQYWISVGVESYFSLLFLHPKVSLMYVFDMQFCDILDRLPNKNSLFHHYCPMILSIFYFFVIFAEVSSWTTSLFLLNFCLLSIHSLLLYNILPCITVLYLPIFALLEMNFGFITLLTVCIILLLLIFFYSVNIFRPILLVIIIPRYSQILDFSSHYMPHSMLFSCCGYSTSYSRSYVGRIMLRKPIFFWKCYESIICISYKLPLVVICSSWATFSQNLFSARMNDVFKSGSPRPKRCINCEWFRLVLFYYNLVKCCL